EPHHRLSQLGPGSDQLLLLGISAAALEPGLRPREECAPPLLDHLGRHLALAAYLTEILTPKEAKYDLCFPLCTPALGQLPLTRRHLVLHHHFSDLLDHTNLPQSAVQGNRMLYTVAPPVHWTSPWLNQAARRVSSRRTSAGVR